MSHLFFPLLDLSWTTVLKSLALSAFPRYDHISQHFAYMHPFVLWGCGSFPAPLKVMSSLHFHVVWVALKGVSKVSLLSIFNQKVPCSQV